MQEREVREPLRLATARIGEGESAALVFSDGVVPVREVRDQDVVECRISSMEPLSNPVRR